MEHWGFYPIVALVAATVLFIGLSFFLFYMNYAEYIYMVAALSLMLGVSNQRQDEFLKLSLGGDTALRLKMIERMALAIPFCLILLIQSYPIHSGVLLVLSYLTIYVGGFGTPSLVLPVPYGRYPFEFTQGARKYVGVLMFGYFLLVMAISVGNYNLGAFSFLVLLATIMAFYDDDEDTYLVWMHSHKERDFLLYKSKIALIYSSLTLLPAVVLMIWVFHLQWMATLIIFLFCLIYVVFFVVVKFAFYGRPLSIGTVLMLLSPFLLPPILVLLLPYYFRRAERHLITIL